MKNLNKVLTWTICISAILCGIGFILMPIFWLLLDSSCIPDSWLLNWASLGGLTVILGIYGGNRLP